jgi:hypothetical protein
VVQRTMSPFDTPRRLPWACMYFEEDWLVLAACWYPVAMCCEVGRSPSSAPLLDEGSGTLPSFEEWADPGFLQVMPDALVWDASAGRASSAYRRSVGAMRFGRSFTSQDPDGSEG